MSGWSGVLVVVVALLAATAGGLVARRRGGNFRVATAAPAVPAEEPVDEALQTTLAGLGVVPGTPVTLLQFSSAFCAPCRTTRVLCADVAARVPGVRHLDVDAESHLEAVRALEIWRTPTVLIVDGRGQVRRRASGAPTRDQLVAAVADLLPISGLGTPLA